MTPTDIVQRQLEAYNDHHLERFIATYSDTVALYRMPATAPALVGKAALAAFYAGQRFNVPTLHAEVVRRTAVGNKVIDHERITGLLDQPYEVAAVYEVVGGLIQNVWMFAAD